MVVAGIVKFAVQSDPLIDVSVCIFKGSEEEQNYPYGLLTRSSHISLPLFILYVCDECSGAFCSRNFLEMHQCDFLAVALHHAQSSLFRFEFKVPNFTFFYRDIYNDSVFILQIILQTFFLSLISSFLFYIIRKQIYRFIILFFIVIFVRKQEYFLIKNKILLISNYIRCTEIFQELFVFSI